MIRFGRAVVSASSNIAEGDARSSNKDSIRFFRIALGLLTELEIASEIGYINTDKLNTILSQTKILGVRIGALIRSRNPKA